MVEQSISFLTAILLGIMLFFSFVVAPSTFRFLNEEEKPKENDTLEFRLEINELTQEVRG